MQCRTVGYLLAYAWLRRKSGTLEQTNRCDPFQDCSEQYGQVRGMWRRCGCCACRFSYVSPLAGGGGAFEELTELPLTGALNIRKVAGRNRGGSIRSRQDSCTASSLTRPAATDVKKFLILSLSYGSTYMSYGTHNEPFR